MNIHGALNLETFDASFVEPTTVNGVSAAQILAKIEVRNPDKRIIHVIWYDYAPACDAQQTLPNPKTVRECDPEVLSKKPFQPSGNFPSSAVRQFSRHKP